MTNTHFLNDVEDLLVRVGEFLDNYVDVVDGDDGLPRPNQAMSLMADVEQVLHRIETMRYPHPTLASALQWGKLL